MKISFFFSRFFHAPIARFSIVTLIALACSFPALCHEIHDAAMTGDLAKVKALLKDNPKLASNKDDAGDTPLHLTAQGGYRDVAKLLLAKRAEVNAGNKDGWTPLHLAAMEGNKDMAELLLANKADINAKSNVGTTPFQVEELLLASNNLVVKIVANADRTPSLLGIKADAKKDDGDASWRGAINSFNDMMEFLPANKDFVNAQTNGGNKPLHGVELINFKDVMELLLANKADVTQANKGMTPLDMATSGLASQKDAVELLRQRGGGLGMGSGIGSCFGMSGVWYNEDSGIENRVNTIIAGDVRPYVLGNEGEEPVQSSDTMVFSLQPGPGKEAPVPIVQPIPPYTDEARNARIEGIVILQAIIRKDGIVDNFRVLKGLGYGLDESVINTAHRWRFMPRVCRSMPFDVVANIAVRFRLGL
jgi:TonB family protein